MVAVVHDGIRIMVIVVVISVVFYGDDVVWFWYLVVNFAQCWCYFVVQCAGDDHHVGLVGIGAEHKIEVVEIVARYSDVYHFDGVVCEIKGYRPKRIGAVLVARLS